MAKKKTRREYILTEGKDGKPTWKEEIIVSEQGGKKQTQRKLDGFQEANYCDEEVEHNDR